MARVSRGADVSGAPPPPRRSDDQIQGAPMHHAGYNDASSGRRIGGNLEQQKLDLLGPAYVLEWTGESQQCARRHLKDAEELRAGIAGNGERNTPSQETANRLFVIQGLPLDYLQVLRDLLDIDPRFIEAHVGRRSYRPLKMRQGAGDMSIFACFDYPELLASGRSVPPNLAAAGKLRMSMDTPRDNGDAVGKPPIHTISSDGDVAMFCRASLWLSPKANVLLLDRPAWSQLSSDVRKAQYHTSKLDYTPPMRKTNVFSSETSLDKQHPNRANSIPSFETLLHENLTDLYSDPNGAAGDLRSLVEDITLHQWTEFFETLATHPPSASEAAETAALYWQVQQSLEKNLSGAEYHARSPHPPHPSYPSASAWSSLLSRLGRRAAFSQHLRPAIARIPLPASPLPVHASGVVSEPPRARRSADEQNQHSLDRVSYMGGLLLPLSIVSSVLSMSDPFGPGGSQFYVFWAAGIPLVCVAVLVIYADSIRKAEVWIEVASSASSSAGSAGSDGSEGLEKTPDVEQAVPVHVAATDVTPEDRTGLAAATLGPEAVPVQVLDEPSMMAEKLYFRGSANNRNRRWQKEQLGWTRACMTAFQLYKLKKGRPPNWGGNVRRGRTA
ncbi:hypothetical protein F4819DRAFT_199667 [Hypoxylon fuscum]|nr:hypothetical protein F4819DRAFT_199667 [Hypoxylon fuscum]